MASPQIEEGYTRLANELFDEICSLPINGSEFRILLFTIRKTYGWGKKLDRISLTQFEKGTGLKRSNVVKSLKSLVVKRLLVKDLSVYKINKNFNEWLVVKRLPPVVKRLLPSSQTTTKTSSQLTTHKRKKETNTKENTIMSSKLDTAVAKELLEFLNSKTGKSYKPVKANLDLIQARLKEGFEAQMIRSVIARKTREWGADDYMSKYLRPKTLFNRTNFAQYEGECVLPKGEDEMS